MYYDKWDFVIDAVGIAVRIDYGAVKQMLKKEENKECLEKSVEQATQPTTMGNGKRLNLTDIIPGSPVSRKIDINKLGGPDNYDWVPVFPGLKSAGLDYPIRIG
jgi:hypothetical protein